LAAQTSAPPRNLQVLVNDTAAQFQLAYRHDPAERQHRYQELATAVKAWRAAERNELNDRLLSEWLRSAMRSSMPGSRASLRDVPMFGDIASVTNSSATARGREVSRVVGDKSVGDPFSDDPLPSDE
jgi:hypothetical protein